LARFSNLAGMIAICSSASDDPEGRARAERLGGADRFFAPNPESLSVDDSLAAQQIIQMLENKGILPVDRFQPGEGI
jgi:hypothetical protein